MNIINSSKVTFLLSFGHTGIDWLHSLLDSHPQILIMPEFSFYRSWKVLEASSAKTPKSMHQIWMSYFSSPNNQGKENKKFYNQEEQNLFSKKFFENLECYGISRRNTFNAIIEAYAFSKNIDINQIRSVVEHEHVSFPYKSIFEDFNEPNILMIYRDPRASIAGFYKGIDKKYSNWPDLNEYFINMSLEEWMNSYELFKKYKYQLNKKFKLVKNEDLSQNTKEEMKKISKWLKVDYNNGLLKSTYPSGAKWVPDSCYITKDQYNNIEKFPGTIDNFFDPIKVKQRWLDVLKDKRDIIMIEFLFNDFMIEFGYERITKNSFFIRLKGLYYYILPHRGTMRFSYYPATKGEVDRLKKKLFLLEKHKILFFFKNLPLFLQSIIINFESMIKHLIIYFLPGDRWLRYDNPKIETLFRSLPRGSNGSD